MNTHCPSLHSEWNSLIKKITSPTAKKALSAGEIIEIINCESHPRGHLELTSTCQSVPSLFQNKQYSHILGRDPLRMILDMASSVAANPVLRLDCKS